MSSKMQCIIISVACSYSIVSFGVNTDHNILPDATKSNVLSMSNMSNTNSTAGVEWTIVNKLEQTIDLQCAIFLVSLRNHYDKIFDKSFLKKKLDDSSLGEDNFCAELFMDFDMYDGLLVDDHSESNALKKVLLALASRQDKLQYYLCRRTRLFQAPLPTNIVLYLDKSMESLDFLSEDEKKKFMSIYVFFKSSFLQVYARHFHNRINPDRFIKKEELSWYNKKTFESKPTNEEIIFLFDLFKESQIVGKAEGVLGEPKDVAPKTQRGR
jgi:hypothetical protein